MLEQSKNHKWQLMVEKNGGYVVKIISSNKSGVSDILACINGRFCAIEGKRKNNQASELQKIHLNKVIQARGLGIVAKKDEDVSTIINWAKNGYVQKPYKIKTIKKFDL
jgi:ABC-type hemin transport system ATPase subunit